MLEARSAGTLRVNDEVGKHFGANDDEYTARVGIPTPIGPLQGGPPSIAARDLTNSIKPVTFMHSPANRGVPQFQLQVAMNVPDQLGEVSYDAATDRVFMSHPEAANAQAHAARVESLYKLTAASGGTPLDGTLLGKPTHAHLLGGAVMGFACSELGELFDQPNLFVMDGALMPGSTAAANPSLTIEANAERIMDAIMARLD